MFELQALKPSTVILGSIWGQSGVNLGSTWVQPGVNLGSTWGQPGVNLGSTWGQLGVIPGSTWGQSGVNLGSICSALPRRSCTSHCTCRGRCCSTAVYRRKLNLKAKLESSLSHFSLALRYRRFQGVFHWLELHRPTSANSAPNSWSPPGAEPVCECVCVVTRMLVRAHKLLSLMLSCSDWGPDM